MEFKSTNRRKIRKTRKHLNELRKRSQNCIKSIEVNSSKYPSKERQSDCNHRSSESSLVTTDRLTLAILPKVICSETVMRSSRVDISEESENDVNLSSNIETESNYDPLSEVILSSDEICSIVERCSDLEQLSPWQKNNTLSFSPPSEPQNCVGTGTDQFSSSQESICSGNMSQCLDPFTNKEEFISSPSPEYICENAINNLSEELWSSETSCFNNEDPFEMSPLGHNPEDYPTFLSPSPTFRDFEDNSPEYIYYPHKLN